MRYIIFLYFSILLAHLQAQDNGLDMTSLGQKNTFHLKFGAGFGYQTLRDDAMSPLLYNGLQIGSYAGAEWRRNKGVWQLDGLFWLGETNAERSGWYTDNYTYAANLSYLRYLNALDAAKWQFSLGGALTSWGSFREHISLVNSDFFYDVFVSLGPSGSVDKQFRFLKRNWQISWQLTIPVLSYGLRPNYSGLNEEPPNEEGIESELKYAEFGSFNVLTNVKSKLELGYPLQNGNRIGLLYYWDFYQSNVEPHSVKQAMQSLQLNLHFKL